MATAVVRSWRALQYASSGLRAERDRTAPFEAAETPPQNPYRSGVRCPGLRPPQGTMGVAHERGRLVQAGRIQH